MDNSVQHGTREILRMNEEVASMSENVFVTKWLLTLREYIAGGEVQIGYWLDENNITSFSEVAILDGAGQELFRVPSILAKADKLLPDAVSSNVSDIMYRVENLNRMIPGKGDAYIRNELTDRVVEQGNHETYQQRWDKIFVKYGQEPVFDTTLSTTTPSAAVMKDNEAFDDYEEL